jgi:hypothetical protein
MFERRCQPMTTQTNNPKGRKSNFDPNCSFAATLREVRMTKRGKGQTTKYRADKVAEESLTTRIDPTLAPTTTGLTPQEWMDRSFRPEFAYKVLGEAALRR